MKANGHAPWTFSETAGLLPITLVKVKTEEELLRHWPWLLARLKVVRKKDVSRDEHWTPDHVREAIRRGFWGQTSVELWLGIDPEGVIEGFVVTSVKIDPFINIPIALICWILWANETLTEQVLPQLEALAKRRYLPAIEFLSGRQGWLKKAPRLGFKLAVMQFRKEVQ